MARKQGTNGSDVLLGGGSRDELSGLGGDDIIYGGGGNDFVLGDDGNDQLFGDAGDDHVSGGGGDDFLSGGAGNDEFLSGTGADILNGGAGADIFWYRFDNDSTTRLNPWGGVYGVDTIAGFESGIDKIKLSDIDANRETPIDRKGSGNEAFALVASTDGQTPGHLTVSYDADTNVTTINAYYDSVAGADMTIEVLGRIDAATDILF